MTEKLDWFKAEVAITDKDDIIILEEFKTAPFDRSKAICHVEGIYKLVYDKVMPDG